MLISRLVSSITPNWVRIMSNPTNTRGLLRNPKHEVYAQNRASGMEIKQAVEKAGLKSDSIEYRPEVKRRIREIMKQGASRAEVSRKRILERIFDDWEQSRRLGQMSSALKAAELMGKEMHKMFVERKEIGQPGDFDNKSEEELREIINKEMEELGWDKPPEPSQIN